MTAADIPAGLTLCRAARWNQIEADWRRFLSLHPSGARVAVDSGDTVIGSVTTLRFHGGFDWLAMVLVSPAYRRQGIASRLVEEAIERLGEDAPVRLDATPAGELVYRNLAFVPEYELARMERIPDAADAAHLAAVSAETARGPAGEPAGKAAGNAADDEGVHVMTDDDLAEVLSLDLEVFGADRGALLQVMRQDAPGYALVERRGSRIDGYAFGRHGFTFDQLGPIVARDEDTARRIAAHIVAAHPRVPFLLDVPRQSTAWVAWLRDIGFREQRGFVRLVRGATPGSESTCHDGRLFATIGADFG